MNRKTGALLALSAVGVAVTLAFALGGEHVGAPEGGTANVENGDFLITVTEEGTFSAKESIPISIATEALQEQMTILSIVPEGATVKKDEVLIELDRSPLTRMISQAEIELQAAQNDLVQAEEDLKIQMLQSELDRERAESDLKAAELELKRWIELEAPKRIKEAEVKIADAENAVNEARRELTDLQTMLKEDLVSAVEVRRAEVQLRKSEAEYEFATLNLRLLKEYDNPSETTALQFKLADRKLFRDGKMSAIESVTRQKQSAVLRATTARNQKEELLRKLKADLERMTVRAPSDGIVLYGDQRNPWAWSNGDQQLKVGSKISPHNPLLTIPNLSAFKIVLQVNEGDINKVQNGQNAEIRPEAIPNTTFKGTVSKVSKVSGGGRRWWESSSAGKFDVEVEVDGLDPRIKPGMKCKVEILIETVRDVVHVPVDAVFEKEGTNLCYVLGTGRPQQRPVKLGRSSHDVIEITEGLKAGEVVTLYDSTRGK
ncbi:MAG: efflux RND transporter periplasmic adaptor subunit [Planctomycetes bacterium]|nr:efflux RND transporter periplasmic adaptor subunit [Planctomycetota bacterium]